MMNILCNVMIYIGSALMVYNIARYAAFVRTGAALDRHSRGLLAVPLVLLVFFLVGYLVVAFTGVADLMISLILLGGSIFVLLLLTVMYSIIRHIRSSNELHSLRYAEMREEVQTLAKDALAVALVDLSRDAVEELEGDDLDETDRRIGSYSELYRVRSAAVISGDTGALAPEALLARYEDGQTEAEEVLLLRRKNGEACYVRRTATLTRLPVTGDVVALIAEHPHNVQMVERVLLENVLMDEYDRVAYLIDGKFRVLVSNDGKKTGLLLPPDREADYETLYLNYILPAQPKDRRHDGPNPLRLSVVDKALAEQPVYHVNAPFVLDGELRYKHIVFYRVDRDAKFYLMLLSDSTSVQEEQMAQNRRLSAALDEATRANAARTRFFTRVSHDLRTPMNGILGFSGLAKTETDPQRLREHLAKVDTSGHRLLSLMDDLFAMSTIDSGTLKLNEEPTDLRQLTDKLKAHIRAMWTEKSPDLRVDLSGVRDTTVLCDPRRLRMMLSRLLENACAFAPAGAAVTLTVTQDDRYTFRIRNRGVHIPEDVLAHIFEPDAWSDAEKREDLPGVGLGMVVAKAFAEFMGGTIDARSDEDGDVEFTVRLPLTPLPAQAQPEGDDAGERALHVLLVDDNRINREIAQLMLTAEGWTVDQAEDGQTAVDAVASAEPGTYDVVLMDVQMPVMNGYEATAAIRALPDPARANIPIIALTANAYQEDSNEALAAGMNGYASKPIDPDALRKVIRKCLAEPRQTEG